MDLFRPYSAEASNMGDQRLYLSTGKRNHASMAQIESRSVTLERNKGIAIKYSEKHRYLISKSITFDMLLTMYDVNSRSILAIRPALPTEANDLKEMQKRLNRMKNANIEVRAIGLQNGWRGYVKSFNDIYKVSRGHCMEIDLFGEEKRHVAIDLKTGLSYDLLLENRVYRPGELKNDEKEEDFQSSIARLSFV
ncbi:MAG: hypothetical protein M1520_01405 [Candidatus Marsarchaeota archaeon]|nr:hypothetical protein [Candidatus Marsarchaeota archaeon]